MQTPFGLSPRRIGEQHALEPGTLSTSALLPWNVGAVPLEAIVRYRIVWYAVRTRGPAKDARRAGSFRI